MKQPAVTRTAIFFLILFVSHEAIAVANAIKQQTTINQQLEFANMVKKLVSDDFDLSSLEDKSSFLEVDLAAKHGMSMEAYQTYEIKQVHDAFREEWSFKGSPVFEQIQTLETIPENVVLSKSEIARHQNINSALLEKAMHHITSHGPQIAPGRCKSIEKGFMGKLRRFTGHCNSNAQCVADGSIKFWDRLKRGAKWVGEKAGLGALKKLEDTGKCLGECGCDKTRYNECVCVVSASQFEAGEALVKDSHDAEKVLMGFGNAIQSAAFGFFDGFLGGFGTELLHMWESPKCFGGTDHHGHKKDSCAASPR